MDIKELMIGDWVYYNPNVFIEDEYEPTKPIKITKITSGEDIDLAIEGCYSPIPLTPEILEKNGIVYDYDATECVADYKYVNIKGYQFYDDDNSVLIDYCNGHIKLVNDITNTIVDMDINYVHELQHALRLCGIEKEITL